MTRTLNTMHAVVTATSAYARTSPILSARIPAERLRVIPLGIVESSYQDAVNEAAGIVATARFAEPFQAFANISPHHRGSGDPIRFFLGMGVLRYYKGFHTLIEAAAATKLPVVIAGDGPQRSLLEALARKLDAPVVFLGHVSDPEKMALLRDCTALVLPSHLRSEAFGMVLVEAAMSSRPMISCEIGTGTSFVNQHGVTGLVVPPEDPSALARAMRALHQAPELHAQFADAARRRYQALFSGDPLGRAYADIYYTAQHQKQAEASK
jgi:rhamnosyl/mannosyltransferase